MIFIWEIVNIVRRIWALVADGEAQLESSSFSSSPVDDASTPFSDNLDNREEFPKAAVIGHCGRTDAADLISPCKETEPLELVPTTAV